MAKQVHELEAEPRTWLWVRFPGWPHIDVGLQHRRLNDSSFWQLCCRLVLDSHCLLPDRCNRKKPLQDKKHHRCCFCCAKTTFCRFLSSERKTHSGNQHLRTLTKNSSKKNKQTNKQTNTPPPKKKQKTNPPRRNQSARTTKDKTIQRKTHEIYEQQHHYHHHHHLHHHQENQPHTALDLYLR